MRVKKQSAIRRCQASNGPRKLSQRMGRERVPGVNHIRILQSPKLEAWWLSSILSLVSLSQSIITFCSLFLVTYSTIFFFHLDDSWVLDRKIEAYSCLDYPRDLRTSLPSSSLSRYISLTHLAHHCAFTVITVPEVICGLVRVAISFGGLSICQAWC